MGKEEYNINKRKALHIPKHSNAGVLTFQNIVMIICNNNASIYCFTRTQHLYLFVIHDYYFIKRKDQHKNYVEYHRLNS